MKANLDERHLSVLEAVVRSYIRGGVPVGSMLVWRNFDVGLKPASIRGLMARLEVMGYLEKPHVSAGRIPTERAYRLYVDRLMMATPPGRREAISIRKAVGRTGSIAERLERVSRMLESISRQVCVAVEPDGGVHVSGLPHVVSESRTAAQVRLLLKMLESRRELATLLLSGTTECDASVSIGSENRTAPMKPCSLVRSPYWMGEARGAIGIIGPLRMEYPRLTALVQYTCDQLTRLFAREGGATRSATQRKRRRRA